MAPQWAMECLYLQFYLNRGGKMSEDQKVLIANRGEIAVRIIQACHELGMDTVAVYSTADKLALHVRHAGEHVCIGAPSARESYLSQTSILSAAELTNAWGIHPGYGFLSENAEFARRCEDAGVVFIGPPSSAIEKLGDKTQAKEIAKAVGCPVVPGSDGVVKDIAQARAVAKKIGYPLVIKAVSGGGGKGIRFVYEESELEGHFNSAAQEARVSFNDPSLYMEKKIVDPRHIEIQIIGDKHGNYVYLGERDCTMQRRRQKLIEEAPSPILDDAMRKKMGTAAVNLVKKAGYYSAGTVEFLYDMKKKEFYFMEVNTRVQVEHTVTEELTGVDIVKEQLRIARGEKLSIAQKDVTYTGHVIQYRINAEDPNQQFAPRPGKIEWYLPPGGKDVRVDSACYAGYEIPPYYDSMVAKLIVSGKNRLEAIAKGKRALREFHIGGKGIYTTIPFHQYMMEHEQFVGGKEYHINYVDQMMETGVKFSVENEEH